MPGDGDADPTSDSGSRPAESDNGTAVKTIGIFKLRGPSDDLPQDWWFASTAIPLLAATIGPLSNILSIAALATPWKVTLPNNGVLPEGADDNGIGIPDPTWEIALNSCSLACGFIGNMFLLLNFTNRVRYIIALPLSIIFWFLASGILVSITLCMQVYIPAIGPGEIYSQGFWYAVFAAILYLSGCLMLVVNMTGYFLGHYPQKFDLDSHQKTLILQTMLFFFWLAGGAAVFAQLEGWSYVNALYWSDVSVLTIGFGDMAPRNPSGRGFLFIFELVGIIFLGLVISSITKFAGNIGSDKIVKMHRNQKRANTLKRTITNEYELREKLGLPPRRDAHGQDADGNNLPRRTSAPSDISDMSRRTSLDHYGHFEIRGRNVIFHKKAETLPAAGGRGGAARSRHLSREDRMKRRAEKRTPEGLRRRQGQKLLLLHEEKDRFDEMRAIEDETRKFRRYYALVMSFLAFSILWCMGALVFYRTEARQQISYYEALYFCWVSLLTIGYGDMNPKSNIGKPFFVVWSLIAVPTMTFLLQQMSNTVVAAVDRGTNSLADWTILPKKGIFREFLDNNPRLSFLTSHPDQNSKGKHPAAPRPPSKPRKSTENLEGLLDDVEDDHDFARHLSHAIQRVARDTHRSPSKRYSYAEWVHFTKLIRFCRMDKEEVEVEEEEEGLIEWDWIGEDSPIVSDMTEPQWVLDRLCESLRRYTRRQARGGLRRSGTGAAPERIEEMEDEGGMLINASSSSSSSSTSAGHVVKT